LLWHSLTATTLNVHAAFIPDADRHAVHITGQLVNSHAEAS
jgi:hypothetical protein